jgi:hypothetical protein
MIHITIDIPSASDKSHVTVDEQEKDQQLQAAILTELLNSPLRKLASSWSINERARGPRINYRPGSYITSVED